MRIGVMGAGGIGGYFGGLLAAAGNDVSFVARGPHLQALHRKGLRITGAGVETSVDAVKATDNPAEIGSVDIVLFAVKLYDTEIAAVVMAPLIGEDTLVIPLQNGVDSRDRLAAFVSVDQILPGAGYVAAYIAEPGVIRNTSSMNSIVFAASDGARGARG